MRELGRFDTALQMFVEKPKEADINHLRFMRFRAERGDFGYKPVSVPRGDFLFKLTDAEIRAYAMIQADTEKPQSPLEAVALNGDY